MDTKTTKKLIRVYFAITVFFVVVVSILSMVAAAGIIDHVQKHGLRTTVNHYWCGKENCSGSKGTF